MLRFLVLAYNSLYNLFSPINLVATPSIIGKSLLLKRSYATFKA